MFCRLAEGLPNPNPIAQRCILFSTQGQTKWVSNAKDLRVQLGSIWFEKLFVNDEALFPSSVCDLQYGLGRFAVKCEAVG